MKLKVTEKDPQLNQKGMLKDRDRFNITLYQKFEIE